MNDKKPKSHGFPCRPRRLGLTAFSLGLLMAGFGAQVQAALDLTVVSTTGAAIGSYKFIINEDNTGTTVQRGPNDLAHPGCSAGDPGYPGSCNWTSIAGSKSNAPVYTQGSQADIANVNFDTVTAGSRYLISVLADGYKIDGAHFTVTNPASPPSITVTMQPTPLPDVTIQAAVFEDITPANSAPDLPAEHGLAGLEGIPNETLGQVTNDFYGNPLCSTYVNNDPNQGVAQIGGHCYSKCYAVDNGIDIGTVAPMDALGRCPTVPADLAPGDPTGLTLIEGGDVPSTAVIEGKVKIPHLGPNRYTLTVIPPNGTNWVQTTTLEGNHDWDAWVMEGSTGLDTEFVVAGEPFPGIFFGFVPGANNLLPPDTPVVTGGGSIKGVVEAINVYWPPVGGTTVNGTVFGGMNGAKIASPQPWSIAGAPNRPWITVSDINNGDTVVRVTQGDANGQFNITGLPASTYTVTWWDERQNYILDLIQIAVGEGEAVDAGILPLAGWWTPIQGSVFNDLNRNGKRDSGEPGVAHFPVAMKRRDNSVMDRGWTGAVTDANGDYYAENVYPMTQWLIMEAYKDNLYTTGVTYQADNGPETTIKGSGVDVNVLPIIGLGGRIDWGVHAYDPAGTTGGLDPRNGGIVGTVSYDTTRNEYDARFAAVEIWQPGISGLPVNLYATVPCPATVTGQPAPSCSVGNPSYLLAADGSYAKGALINQYISETWERPKGCTARNVDGNPLVHGTDENVLPTDPNADCLEGPLMGLQFGPLAADQGTPDASFGASLDGNYGFGDACFIQSGTQTTPGAFDPATGACTSGSLLPLPARDYLVEVAVPTDAFGKPTYQVTREEDVNISNGDDFVPQIPPPACAGPLHTVDVLGIGTDGPNAVDNATFRDAGGSPYEGMSKPLCNMKLVTVSNGRSIAPTFNYFTDVPLPGRFWGLLVDNVNISSDPRSLLYGERPGVPFGPIGIYDYTNRLIYTTESDFNGLFDVLMPSTNRINCPTPSGVCANLYRFVGNDPGTPGNLNTNWNPQYQTIAAEFEAMPGVTIPADLAPATVGQQVQLPGSQTSGQVSCPLNDPTLPAITPELLAVSQPYVIGSGSFTIDGQGFGTAGTVALVNSSNVSTLLPTTGWSDTDIAVTVPDGTTPGAYQLKITNSNSGRSTVNALTFHVIGGTYTPAIVEVGPGKTYAPAPIDPNPNAPADHAIQSALEAAPTGALVVVYPNTPTADPRVNPRGAYFENLVIHKAVKLQGVGPGGFQGTTLIPGSIIDGSAIQGDTTQAVDWLTLFDTLVWHGNQTIYEGAVISVYVQDGEFSNSATRMARIDGFDLRGGDQQGFPNNINIIGGGQNGQAPNIVNQAGAIFVNAYAHYLQITNNVIQNNGGGYGTLRIGTPNLAGAVNSTDDPNQHNDHIRIANNRVIANGGANLAGGIGIFSGSNNYEVANNDICGNSSVEYGGGMSVYGLSPLGSIHDNRVYLNRSLDEGGGIMIAGTLPNDPSILSTGVGGVDIFNNMIQANLSGDDGGGIRFLMSASKTGNNADPAGFDRSRVFNNIIVNNVSPHEGGGISFDDAANVQVYNNTIMKNITTATAITSNGSPAPAGLSTAANSQLLIDAGGPAFFSPVNFVNNIFWDNRSGSRSASTPFVSGIGLAGDLSPINYWDMGAADGSGSVSPTNTLMQVSLGTNTSPTNQVGVDPAVISQYDTSIAILPWRTNPQFTGSMMVALDLPPNQAGNYHLSNGSPAKDTGVAPTGGLTFDIDNQPRPAGVFDKGADEVVVSTDLSITKTDAATTKDQGQAVSYTIVVSNLGPNAANNAIFRDPSVANLTVTTVACGSASGGAVCPTLANTSLTLMRGAGIVIPSLPSGGSVTFTVSGSVTAAATGNVVNTATVSAPSGVSDADLSNNSATDTDTINAPVTPTLPSLGVLDSFNRADSSNLGSRWRLLQNRIGISNNQAYASSAGKGFWANGAAFGSRQGAALTFTNSAGTPAAPLSGTSLILKASGTYFIGNYQYFVRVRYVSATQVVVESTRNFGASYTTAGTINLPSGTTFANGNTLSAWVDASGVVRVFRTAGTSTYLGSATLPNSSVWTTRGGRIGMQLPTGARVDNFAGGTVP